MARHPRLRCVRARLGREAPSAARRLNLSMIEAAAFGVLHHRVHRGGHDRHVEAVGVDLPVDVHLLGVAGAARGGRSRCRRRNRPGGRAWPGRSRSQSPRSLSVPAPSPTAAGRYGGPWQGSVGFGLVGHGAGHARPACSAAVVRRASARGDGGRRRLRRRSASAAPPTWPASTRPTTFPPGPPAPATSRCRPTSTLGSPCSPRSVTDAERLGARLADFQPQDDVRVMLDPVGHPSVSTSDS